MFVNANNCGLTVGDMVEAYRGPTQVREYLK